MKKRHTARCLFNLIPIISTLSFNCCRKPSISYSIRCVSADDLFCYFLRKPWSNPSFMDCRIYNKWYPAICQCELTNSLVVQPYRSQSSTGNHCHKYIDSMVNSEVYKGVFLSRSVLSFFKRSSACAFIENIK